MMSDLGEVGKLVTMWKRPAARLRDDERGAIAVQFALLLIPSPVLTFGLIDLGRVSVQKRQLQDALDAATLMAARSTATNNGDLDTIGDAAWTPRWPAWACRSPAPTRPSRWGRTTPWSARSRASRSGRSSRPLEHRRFGTSRPVPSSLVR